MTGERTDPIATLAALDGIGEQIPLSRSSASSAMDMDE
jgi:hypothetical protein